MEHQPSKLWLPLCWMGPRYLGSSLGSLRRWLRFHMMSPVWNGGAGIRTILTSIFEVPLSTYLYSLWFKKQIGFLCSCYTKFKGYYSNSKQCDHVGWAPWEKASLSLVRWKRKNISRRSQDHVGVSVCRKVMETCPNTPQIPEWPLCGSTTNFIGPLGNIQPNKWKAVSA